MWETKFSANNMSFSRLCETTTFFRIMPLEHIKDFDNW